MLSGAVHVQGKARNTDCVSISQHESAGYRNDRSVAVVKQRDAALTAAVIPPPSALILTVTPWSCFPGSDSLGPQHLSKMTQASRCRRRYATPLSNDVHA